MDCVSLRLMSVCSVVVLQKNHVFFCVIKPPSRARYVRQSLKFVVQRHMKESILSLFFFLHLKDIESMFLVKSCGLLID